MPIQLAGTVLLVEDDEDSRELMAEVLEAAGFAVRGVGSGEEALRALAERRPDAVVTDVGMPGVGGLEVAQAAKALDVTLPVLVVTGYSARADLARAEGKEIDRLLVKPVDPDALVAALRRLLPR